jgi:hypothetical protein
MQIAATILGDGINLRQTLAEDRQETSDQASAA